MPSSSSSLSGEDELLKILAEGTHSGLRQSQAYFASFGVKLEVTEGAARRIAREAARQPRLGARALKEVLRRIVSPLEYDPKAAAGPDDVMRIDTERVETVLDRGKKEGGSSSTVAGWDQSFPAPSGGS